MWKARPYVVSEDYNWSFQTPPESISLVVTKLNQEFYSVLKILAYILNPLNSDIKILSYVDVLTSGDLICYAFFSVEALIESLGLLSGQQLHEVWRNLAFCLWNFS